MTSLWKTDWKRDRKTKRKTKRKTDRKTDRNTDRNTDRKTDRKTDIALLGISWTTSTTRAPAVLTTFYACAEKDVVGHYHGGMKIEEALLTKVWKSYAVLHTHWAYPKPTLFYAMPQLKDMQEFTGDGCTHGQAWLAILNQSTTCMDHTRTYSYPHVTVHM